MKTSVVKAFLLSLVLIHPMYGQEEEIAIFMPAPASGSSASYEAKSKILEMFNQFSLWIGNLINLQFKTDAFLQKIESAPPVLKEFEKKHGFFSPIQPLTGNTTVFKEDLKLASDYLVKIDKISNDPILRRFYINEFISKVIAYRSLQKDDKLIIPSYEKPGVFYHYTVTKIFDLGLKMPAFGLEAEEKEASSMILFRGTDLHLSKAAALASVVADLDVFGPGYTAFFLVKNDVESFLMKNSEIGKKVISLGYSLGGVLSMYTQLFFHQYIDIKNSAAFNPPGFQKKLLKLAEETNVLEHFSVYVNQNDAVSKWGFLAGSVEVLSSSTSLKPLEAHTFLMGAQDQLSFYRCDLLLENKRHLYLFAP
jgi:hypothetical protein